MDSSSLIIIVLMVVVLYVLVIRPQQRRLKQHQALVSSIEVGDEVVTIGGLYGHVRTMDDMMFSVEIAPGTVVRFARQAISRKIEEAAPEVPDADRLDA
ncbi:MAG: preprotein translocase subunit YajC [Actinomycetota bacterium]